MSSAVQKGPAPYATYSVAVLGCKVNQYEARRIEELLERGGLRRAGAGEAPDVAVVHTCAITGEAMRKSAQAIRRAVGRVSPSGCAILTGCGGDPAVLPEGLSVGGIVPPGPGWQERLCETLAKLPLPRPGDVMSAPATLASFAGHTRAFLKIQDGCDLSCSYCIVPLLRRGSRDRAVEEILREAEALAAAGHAEVVVTGISVGLFGRHGGTSLPELVRRLAAVPGLRRLRMSSLHPSEVTPALLSAWSESSAMAPHLHLPLQSGSDRILRAMRRGYTRRTFLDAVGRARAALDRPAFNTDVIVGFPGETDADFESTLDVCREAGFARIHAFPFSPRPGTDAAAMGGRLPAPVVRGRMERLQALGRELSAAFHRRFEGEDAVVLAETTRGGGVWEGYSERYIPVRFRGGDIREGTFRTVRLLKADADGAEGVCDAER